MNRRRLLALSILAPLAACAPTPQETQGVKDLFAMTFVDTTGTPQALSQWRGKVLVVNYWATWCPPCKMEMPGFSALHEKYAAQGVQFVGIGIDSPEKIVAYQREAPVAYPLLIAPAGGMASAVALGNDRRALPFTAIIDRRGRLAATRLGLVAESQLEAQLRALLRE